MRKVSSNNNGISSRAKISKTLKEKWQDPEFRKKMVQAMNSSKRRSSTTTTQSQREKISAAMKKKWQDKEYRNKAIQGMATYRESLPPKPKKRVSRAASTIKLDNVFEVTPMRKATKKTKRKTKSTVKVASTSAAKKKTKKKKKAKKSAVQLAQTATSQSVLEKPTRSRSNGQTKEMKDDGDISRMREERRDLYDLLYGDEPEELMSDDENSHAPLLPDPSSESGSSMMAFFGGGVDLDDENLDDFDPYGLDDN